MTIEEGIKHKGKPFWIPGASRDDLPAFFKSLGFTKGAEIGVLRGDNIIKYADAGLEMYGIDPYSERKEYVYKQAVKKIGDRKNCTLIKESSMEALKRFPKYSLDFVYVDGSHEFGFVAMDLHLWMSRLHKGGVMAGHDYFPTLGNRGMRQVRIVVDAFCEANDIENYWILGTKEDHKEENLSYLFFKHW
jgi:hypothetical protein